MRFGASRSARATLGTVLTFGALLAAGALGLDWIEYRLLVRTHSTDVYVALVALAFLGLGLWAGFHLFRPAPAARFEPNDRARRTLGISDREVEVLRLLAAGRSNKEIASVLGVSPNTVKSHLAKLFAKLDVNRRTQAIARARDLGMIE